MSSPHSVTHQNKVRYFYKFKEKKSSTRDLGDWQLNPNGPVCKPSGAQYVPKEGTKKKKRRRDVAHAGEIQSSWKQKQTKIRVQAK